MTDRTAANLALPARATALQCAWGLLRDTRRLRQFILEDKCIPWRLRRVLKRRFLRVYRILRYGRVNINTPAYWDAIWTHEGADTWRTYPARFTRICELVPVGSRVLDVGCGAGVLLRRLKRERNCDVCGADISPAAMALAGRCGIPGAAAAMPLLPFRSGAFDVVIATELIEHLDLPRAAVHEMARCLRPGGRLVMTVPNGSLGPECEDQHMHSFTRESFAGLAARDLRRVDVEEVAEVSAEDGDRRHECLLLSGEKASGRLPSAAVIIPTKNRRQDLELAVRSLFEQTVPPEELLIVDQSPAGDGMGCAQRLYDEAAARAPGATKLRYIHDPSIPGSAVARNRGIESSTADILVFLDDDVILEPGFLEQMLRVFAGRPEVAGVSGVVTNYRRPPFPDYAFRAIFHRGPFHDERQPIYWNADRLRHHPPIRVGKFGAGGMGLRRAALGAIRFDSGLKGVPGGEDIDLCCRLAGHILVMAPACRYVHERTTRNRVREYWLQAEVRKTHYLYHRNWRHGLRNRLCFAWVNAGYLLACVAAIATKRTLEPWRAWCAGKRQARELMRVPRRASEP